MSTQVEAAIHIDISERRFRELLDLGVIARQPAAEYDLDIVRVTYIRHLRKIAAGRGGVSGELELSTERAKLAREQFEAAALKNAIARGEFCAVDEVIRLVTDCFITLRQRILIIGGKLSDGLVGLPRDLIRAKIDQEISEVLTELSEPGIIAERAAEAARQL